MFWLHQTPLNGLVKRQTRHLQAAWGRKEVSKCVFRGFSTETSSLLSDKNLFRTDGYINGKWIREGKETYDVLNPGNGDLLAQVPNLGTKETFEAINAAANSFVTWKQTTAKERSIILKDIARLHVENADDLAKIITLEAGKPLAEAKGEVLYGASYFEWFAEEAKRQYGDVIPDPVSSRRTIVTKNPVGVCALITPWNFPNAMIARKAAAALAAGCTMVIKPASDTPISALAIAELGERAGLPPGVLNVIPSGLDKTPEVGNTMLESEIVRKLSFTGSTRVGKMLMKKSAETCKKVSMELGGNAPFIVFDDADIDAAAEGAVAAKFRNAGQTCVCANRIYVQRSVYNEFATKFAAKVKALKTGYGFENVTIGPLINEMAIEKTQAHVDDAVSKGAEVLAGGSRIDSEGHYFEPTVLGNTTDSMIIAKEETFGPVAPIFQFDTEEEVIARANAVEVGLASYFYANDVGRIFRVTEGLEYGMVGVNTGIISAESAPFGGIKESGLGREGSKYGLDDYTELKYMALNLP
mmetsp:Transcript_2107/g.2413  ORF Transcript_2107/g.2413 Transcript_2107/m.2413 type:complete len:527 (-) Transcript_2107:1419-2999(-)